MEEDSFQAMKYVKEALPPEEVAKEWDECACDEIVESCRLKSEACPYVRE